MIIIITKIWWQKVGDGNRNWICKYRFGQYFLVIWICNLKVKLLLVKCLTLAWIFLAKQVLIFFYIIKVVNFCQHVLKPLLGSFTRVFIVCFICYFFFSASQDYATHLGPQTQQSRMTVPVIAHSLSNPTYQGTPTPQPKNNPKPTVGSKLMRVNSFFCSLCNITFFLVKSSLSFYRFIFSVVHDHWH